MDIAKKLDYAKLYIDSIATHDDAPLEHVAAALDELTAYGTQQLAQAQARRAAVQSAE